MIGISSKEIDLNKEIFAISPSFEKVFMSKGKMIFQYDIGIFAPNYNAKKIRIQTKDLKDKLEEVIKDKNYIKIKSFDSKKVYYSFDLPKWIREGIKSIKIENLSSSFEKIFKLGKKLPAMVSETAREDIINKEVIKAFKNNMPSNIKKSLFNSITYAYKLKLNIDFFDYRYDILSNKIIVGIKPVYMSGLMAIRKEKLDKKKEARKVNFDRTVYNLIKVNKS